MFAKIISKFNIKIFFFRRRIFQPPEPGYSQLKPKRIRLCFDVSGSMYRFNGYDQRLQKSLETALLVMESLDNNSVKIKVEFCEKWQLKEKI